MKKTLKLKKEKLIDVMARNVAGLVTSVENLTINVKEIKENMATKDDLRHTEFRLQTQIESLKDSHETLSETEFGSIQQRMMTVEKDIRALNKHVFKTA